MRKPSHSASNRQEAPLEGFDVPASGSQDNTPRIAPQSQTMKVAIVGSQGYKHLQRVIDYVQSLPLDTIIVSGGAIGPDQVAEHTAKQRGMPEPIIFLPEWAKYGKPAGPIRNKLIVQEADKLVAFWDQESKGTQSSIKFARERGIEVCIFGDAEHCCQCDQVPTVFSPTGDGYCQQHSYCIRCGGSVMSFVPSTIKGTVTIETYVCPCVRRHEIKVHNEVIALKAKRADEEAAEAKANKKRGKTA